MSVSLDNTLKTFDDKVTPGIVDMKKTHETIMTKIKELDSCSQSAYTSLSECYSGGGTNSTTSYFNAIKKHIDNLSSSLESDLQASFTKSDDLLTKIKEIKTIIEDVNAKEDKLSEMGGLRSIPDDGSDHSADKNHNERVNSLKSEIESLKNDINKKESDAKELLYSLQAYDSELMEKQEEQEDFGTDYMGLSLDELKNLTPGSYTEHEYTAKNGKTVKYWIYVPENINTLTGLPVTLYMCGGGEKGNKVNSNSLPMYIKDGTVKPQGIVVTLRQETNEDYTDPAYLTASKEICDNVVTTFKADTNRISISGHSNGGRGSIAMAARYPNYFSVCAPVSGFSDRLTPAVDSKSSEEVLNNLKSTHLVCIGGTADQGPATSMNNLVKLLANGGDASIEILKGYAHTTIYHKYYEPITINGTEYSSLLDYLFTYTKA